MTNAMLAAAAGVMVWGTAALGTAHGQTPTSAAPARELVRTLEAQGIEAIATIDPAMPDTFVAALYIPGSQLLVVSARHPAVEGVMQRLTLRQFRDVYLDLQGTPTPASKFFVQDAGADGVGDSKGGGNVDVLYEDGVRQTLFNNDPKAQKLTTDEYRERLASADARYARLLAILTSATRPEPQVPAGAVPTNGRF